MIKRISKRGFAGALEGRGATWESMAPAIIKEEGDWITVDTENPAFPLRPPPKPILKGMGGAVGGGEL